LTIRHLLQVKPGIGVSVTAIGKIVGRDFRQSRI
jgi:hypothetical protein